MTIGNELDQAFYNFGQRIAKLENTSNTCSTEELEDRLVELENNCDNNDVDDLRCDLECQIEEVNDTVGYHDDRLDDVEAYKITEEEAEYIVDRKMDDRFNEAFDHVLQDLDLASLLVRVAELELRLNQPTLGGRLVRWLREGPSIKETATGWYAGIRRGR